MAVSSGQWAISYVVMIDAVSRKCSSKGDTFVFLSSSWKECKHDG